MRKLLVLLAGGVCVAASAGTLTWTGGASGDIAAAANWGGTAPQAGDTLVIGTATTLTGAFNFGSGGLTLDCSAEVTSSVVFGGTGVMTKQGSAMLTLNGESAYSGGTLIKAGKLKLVPGSAAGTGMITVDRTTEGADSIVYFYGVDGATTTYPNDIYVKGTFVDMTLTGVQSEVKAVSQKAPLQARFDVKIDGTVTGDGSIMYRNESTKDTTFNKAVTVPEGSTFAVDGVSGNADFAFNAEVLGSFTKFSSGKSWNSCTFKVPCGRAGETLAVLEGTMYLSSSGQWRGSTVVITNLPFAQYKPSLSHSSGKPFPADVTIRLATDCSYSHKIAGQLVSELYFNDVKQPAGTYSTGALAGSLKDTGSLFVTGESASFWVGGGSGKLSEASNWMPAGVPTGGGFVCFTNATTLVAEDFDIGAAGLTIACLKDVTSEVRFIGTGVLTKQGAATLTMNGESAYSGGTLIEAGKLKLVPGSAAGTGTITIDRSSEGADSIVCFQGTSGVTTTYPNTLHVKGKQVNTTVTGVNSEVKAICEKAPIQAYYPTKLSGAVTGDGSIVVRVDSSSSTLTFDNTVTVPEGETIVVDGRGGSSGATFNKEVLGSFTKLSSGYSWNSFTFKVACGRPGETLTVHEGAMHLGKPDGAWRGSSVVVTNLPFVKFYPFFYNDANKPLRSDATLRLASSCGYDHGVSPQILSHLYFNDVDQPEGIYTAGMLDGVLTGAGQLLVGGQVETWVGGGSGKWSVASNWDPAVVPGEGCFVCFTNATYTEQEDVNIGTKGLTLNTTGGDTVVSNNFIGAGGLAKYGDKALSLFGCSTYTGPTQVYGGFFYVQREDAILPENRVTVYSNSGTTPGFGTGLGIDVRNDIAIVGTNGSPYVLTSNSPRFWGRITSEDDFEIANSWASGMWLPARFLGSISAPGKTVTIGGWDPVCSTAFECDVNASIYKNYGGAPFLLKSGTIGSRNETLTITSGTNFVYAAAFVAMTNIVLENVSGAKCNAAMSIESGKSIDPEAEIRLGANTSLVIPTAGTFVRIGRLFVDGVEKPAGRYRASGNPTWLGGKGVLCVGPKQGMYFIVR